MEGSLTGKAQKVREPGKGIPLGESIPGRGNSGYKGPEAEAVQQTHRVAEGPEWQSTVSQGTGGGEVREVTGAGGRPHTGPLDQGEDCRF